MKKRFVFVLVGLLTVSIALTAGCYSASTNSTQPALKSKKLLDGTITLKSDNSTHGRRLAYYDVPFSVTNNMANPNVQGNIYYTFSSSGFSTHPTLLVLDDSSFNNWVSRNETAPIYESLNASITVKLPTPGTYHLVFYNQAEFIPGKPPGTPGGDYANSPVKITANINLYWYQ
jgi:type 1 fimbria pilin